jgi:large subunit ribosomal protein L24
MKLKIKKGSTVKVITGSDKGKQGEVLTLDAKNMKVKVAGVKIQTHFDKKDGLKKLEGFIDYSNVKLVESAKAEKKKAPAKKKTASKSA